MLVGLTGGIACGKTTVARMLAARGARIIDADQVSRDVVRKGTEGLRALVEAFGADILREDGELNRPKLGAMVFSGHADLEQLNRIIHPLVAAESLRQITRALGEGAPMVVYDAALLVETGRADDFRPLVVVAASEANQRVRLMARNELTTLEAQQRIDSQMPVAEKIAQADYVIHNDGSVDDTEERVAQLWDTLVGETER